MCDLGEVPVAAQKRRGIYLVAPCARFARTSWPGSRPSYRLAGHFRGLR